jgi:hypothetical protein
MKRLVFIFLTTILTSNAVADDTPIVEIEITPSQVTIGESIRMRVTVLGPTWFLQPPRYPLFEVTNAVVRLPPDSSRPTRKRVGSVTWTGIVRNYEVIPLIAGSYRLDDLIMQVTYASPEDTSPITVNIDVPKIEFAAVVPQGAEGLNPYIAGRQLNFSRELDGDVSTLEFGDALIVRYTAQLEGLPSMFIPDLSPAMDVPGVSAYADQPRFSDDDLATRSEKLTFVFEAGGDFEIPRVSLDWWNLETSAIETAAVPAMTVTVLGPALAMAQAADAVAEPNRLRMVTLVFLAAIAFLIFRRLAAALSVVIKERKQRRLKSEVHAFEQLNDAIRSGEAHSTYERLLAWLDRLDESADAKSFAYRFGDADLQDQIALLRSALYSDTDSNFDVQKLAKPLDKARSRFLTAARQQAQSLLPNLNP